MSDAREVSSEALCECFEIAESMDDVRGIGRTAGRAAVSPISGDAVDRGEGGDELPKDLVSGRGEETFRSWL